MTLTAIANRAGVHASGVRRYFDSREEILLTLAGDAWNEWAQALIMAIADADRPLAAAPFGELVAQSLADHPFFCDVLGHITLTLEREVPLESARRYKLIGLDAVARMVTAITEAVPHIPEEQAFDLIASSTAVAASFWQIAHPPPVLETLYKKDSRLAHASIDFIPRLSRVVQYIVDGILAESLQGVSHAVGPNFPPP